MTHGSYTLKDIVCIRVPHDIREEAHEVSTLLQDENFGEKTQDGGSLRDIKGYIGQWAVNEYLSRSMISYRYSQPYVSKQYGDDGDIFLYPDTEIEEVLDVKTRGKWNPNYWYNISLLMSEHEREERERVSGYIFVTLDDEMEHAYILGAITYDKIWSIIKPIDNPNFKFKTAGEIRSHKLVPIKRYIYKS